MKSKQVDKRTKKNKITDIDMLAIAMLFIGIGIAIASTLPILAGGFISLEIIIAFTVGTLIFAASAGRLIYSAYETYTNNKNLSENKAQSKVSQARKEQNTKKIEKPAPDKSKTQNSKKTGKPAPYKLKEIPEEEAETVSRKITGARRRARVTKQSFQNQAAVRTNVTSKLLDEDGIIDRKYDFEERIKLSNNSKIIVKIGDIFDATKLDYLTQNNSKFAVVYGANPELSPGAAQAGIFDKLPKGKLNHATSKLLAEAQTIEDKNGKFSINKNKARLRHGHAVLTESGVDNLYIIHALAPCFNTKHSCNKTTVKDAKRVFYKDKAEQINSIQDVINLENEHGLMMKSAIKDALEAAKDNGITHLVLPFIGIGIFGYDVAKAREAYRESINEFYNNNPDVQLDIELIIYSGMKKEIAIPEARLAFDSLKPLEQAQAPKQTQAIGQDLG